MREEVGCCEGPWDIWAADLPTTNLLTV